MVNSPDDAVLVLDRVSKKYEIYDKPIDRLKQFVVPRIQSVLSVNSPPRSFYKEFWALRDVSFSVSKGEAVGIVGRNGAGKSTLLQIIAGTLLQTAGTVHLRGKIGALLELGSGFSPEFTGRENVQLSASLLGFADQEIKGLFDAIAAFADIGDFMEQPVKTYSSGMMMRLAFAVQTAVPPEVLIVDEALSVGDMFFQAKCMSRMRKMLSDGTTLLFVSHDTGTVKQLCDRAILLVDGRVEAAGRSSEVVDRFARMDFESRNASAARSIKSITSRHAVQTEGSAPTGDFDAQSSLPPTARLEHRTDREVSAVGSKLTRETLKYQQAFEKLAEYERTGIGGAEFINVQLLREGEPFDTFDYGELVTLRQVIRVRRRQAGMLTVYKIRTLQGVDAVFGDTRLTGNFGTTYLEGACYVFDWSFRLNLMHGHYTVLSALSRPPSSPGEDWTFLDVVPISAKFTVSARRKGMIDGLVAWKNDLNIFKLAELPTLESSE